MISKAGYTSLTDDELLEKARQAARRAYCPYSNFPVGAAIIGKDDKLYTGCNIENASYNLGLCAERVAIFNAIAAGNKKIKKIAVVCLEGDTSQPNSLTSCGACRQVISEFLEAGGQILIDGVGKFTIDELLPLRFQSLKTVWNAGL